MVHSRRHRWATYFAAGAFSPTQIAGLQLWLKADAITGLNDGDPVATWTATFGNNATQGTPAARPLWIASGLNGKPVVRGDGTDDIMTVAVTVAQPATVVVVATFRTLPSEDYIFDGLASAARQSLRDTGAGLNLFAGVDAVALATGGASSHVYAAVFSGAASFLRRDGTQSSNKNAGTNSVTGYTVFGRFAAASGDVDIAEYLVYDGEMSEANLLLLEAYLATKYGL